MKCSECKTSQPKEKENTRCQVRLDKDWRSWGVAQQKSEGLIINIREVELMRLSSHVYNVYERRTDDSIARVVSTTRTVCLRLDVLLDNPHFERMPFWIAYAAPAKMNDTFPPSFVAGQIS